MASKRKRLNLIPREPVVHQNLRLPKSLHRTIKAAARKARTSMHAEILLRLTLPITREEVVDRLQQLIFEVIHGQAQTRPAPQNGPAPPQRAPESDHG